MAVLPDDVRKKDERCEGAADPEPAPTDDVPSTREHKPDHKTEAQEEDADLVQEADARDQAKDEPQPLVPAGKEPHDDPEENGPEEQVEHVHRVDAAEGQGDGQDGQGKAGEKARERTAPELFRDAGRDEDGRGSGEGCHDAQRKVGVTGELPDRPRHPPHEGRVVHVAPGRVSPAGHVVQLVAEDAVAREEREMKEKQAERRSQIGEALEPRGSRVGDDPRHGASPVRRSRRRASGHETWPRKPSGIDSSSG